ncbi:MAG: right-handed parallel beta-helix repeat-containing protein [Pirellulales bacterium]|nr:right-handed parallel beta-helix repeat-containing protein [Pirellulales bacterium]
MAYFQMVLISGLLLGNSVVTAETYHVAQGHRTASDANPGTQSAPWKTITKAAEALLPGDTVVIHAGTYREWVRPDRSGTSQAPIVFQAAAGERVVLTGADVVSGWVPDRGAVWRKEPWPYRFATHPDDQRHRLIGRCEQVVVDGRLLKQVARREKMTAGSFCADTDAKALYVWLPDGGDPGGRLVEASVRPVCFGPGWGRPPRHHIRLRGLTIRYAANTAQRGALFATGNGWLVEDCEVQWTNGSGISFRGDDVVFRRVRTHHNGQQGMGGGGRRFCLEDVIFDHNNLKGFDQNWEAGGTKITHGRSGVLRRCRAVANTGTGIWFDIDVRDVLVEQCFAKDNAGHGIFVEISGGFTIRNNLCVHNGTEDRWGSGGISLGESDHCTIENNTCVLNPTGISLREQGPRTCRSIDGQQATYHIHDVTVRGNVCALNRRYQIGLWWDNPFFGPHPSSNVGLRGTPYDPDQNQIQFEGNLYWSEGDQALALWGCPWRPEHKRYLDLATWQRQRKQDLQSLAADPQFVSPAAGDWNLRPRSPARRLGAGPAMPLRIPSSIPAQFFN